MFQTFSESQERPRINEAVALIGDRLRRGEKTTAIVLPPRSGKSDVIRLAAIEYQELGLVESSVVLSPWIQTRDQLVLPSKVKKMCDRYSVVKKSIVMTKLRAGQIAPDFWKGKPRRQLFSMTIGTAMQSCSLEILKDTTSYLSANGKRLLLFIDEGHTVAGSDGWGSVAIELENAGAHVALLTGSPERSDNIAPYGFRTQQIDRESIKVNVYKGLSDDGLRRKYERQQADKITSRLIADLEVSLAEVWTMGILAHIQVRWFTCEVNDQLLSEVNDEVLRRRALYQALRNDEVLEESIRIFVEDIHARRQSRPTSAGIIFVGNDRDGDESDNWHAKTVRSKLIKIWRAQFGRDPITGIATLDERNDGRTAAAILARFRDNDEGDALILKQMGGVGFDVERLKTILDLSTVRTKAASMQRWLRLATKWANVAHGTLILPNDSQTVALYDEIVQSQGGEFSELSERTKLNDFEVEIIENGDELTISNADEAGVSDCSGRFIDVDENHQVDVVLQQYPQLVERHSRTEIWELIKAGAFPVQEASAPQSAASEQSSTIDIDSECAKEREKINHRAEILTRAEVPYIPRKENPVACELYVERITQWHTLAKTRAGIRSELKRCIDLEKLQKAAQVLKEACEERGIALSE